ncbi:MAG: DUF4157 domain-containing protein [Chloroflexi bacterium]|nr:DUF4157 domain-containing protein [Chloroflexota bacterium]
MSTRASPSPTAPSLARNPSPLVLQRQCACGGTAGVDGECAACRQKRLVQRAPAAQTTASAMPSSVNAVIQSSGRPLDASTRGFMESRFGHDFNRVRMHDDASAAQSARAVSARAYTVGEHLVFAARQYAPHSIAGRMLLAHELTHVVQQSAPQVIHRQTDDEARTVDEPSQPSAASNDVSTLNEEDETLLTPDPVEPLPNTGSVDAAGAIVPANDPSEHEADAVSRAVLSGVRLPKIPRASVALGRVQRQIYYEDRSALTWADFTGGPDASSPFDAVTWTGMQRPDMKPESKADDTGTKCTVGKKSTTEYKATVALNPAINVRALMKPGESWVKEGKKQDKLLKHEQGHFNISNVLAEKIEAQLITWANANKGSATKCGKTQATNEAITQWNALDSSTKLLAIWDKGEGLRKQAQKDYDDETKHSVDAAKQTAWEGEIAKNLPKYTF